MIHAYVLFCMVLNPTMCVRQEIVPADYREITSPMDCIMGGLIYNVGRMQIYDGTSYWVNKGGVRCVQEDQQLSQIQEHLRSTQK